MGASPSTTGAQTSELRIAQYHHTRWTKADGAPELIADIAQAPNGFLWLASEAGLSRFDGLNFEQISPLEGELSGPVNALHVSRTGAVWAALLNSQRILIYQDGQLSTVQSPVGEGRLIGNFVEDVDGSVWIGVPFVGEPMYRLSAGKWLRVDATAGLPRSGLTSLLRTGDGAIWAGYTNYALRRPPGGGAFELVPSSQATMGRLALDQVGRVWLADRAGARALSGRNGSLEHPAPPLRLPADDSGRPAFPLFDRHGNFWEATRLSGLIRAYTGSGPSQSLDRFTASQGLSSNAMMSVLEDREGSIWVGTTNGLDRFRRAPVVPEPELSSPGPYGNHLLSASDGSVYIAETDTLYRVLPGGSPEAVMLHTGYPEGLCEGRDGTIWLASNTVIRGFRQGHPPRVLPRPPRAERELSDCVDDAETGFQATAGADGVFRLSRDGWQPVTLTNGHTLLAKTIVRDGAGRLWTNLNRNALGRWTAEGWQEAAPAHYLQTGTVTTLFPLPSGVLFAGREGVGRYSPEGGVAGPVRALMGSNGLVTTPNGDLWAFSTRGLIHMKAQAFLKALSDPAYDPAIRIFGPSDGLLNRYANQSWRSLVQGGDGRLWMSTVTGTAWLDPARITVNRLAPPVVITSIESGALLERDPTGMELDAGSQDLSISFSVLSLASPERVQVRYRLEGHDEGWVEPGQRRQAFYTNLSPGRYRFLVIAANEDGVWNRDGASLSFKIPPTFLQSIWFKFLCGIAFLGIASAAYLLRVRHVTAELKDRFQVRIAERERIARELHDTWLQGVQGLVLSFQSVANRLPPDSALKGSVDDTLDRADGLLIDGRRRLRDLRRRAADTDLAQALADAARELISGGSQARITIEGAPRPLDPAVAEELLRISEESMRNAVQHGDDVGIEVALAYTRREVRLSIRDDGPGLPADVLQTGEREGHFGLLGMQERAKRIGAEFRISSEPRLGTEVTITVPSVAAYRDRPAIKGWWHRLIKRETSDQVVRRPDRPPGSG